MAKKILMINGLTDQSGSGVRFWDICKEMFRQGNALCFLERSSTGNGRDKHAKIMYRSTAESGILWLDILRATWLNVFYGFAFRPDYVYALKPLPNACLPALLLNRVCKSKIILDIDDLDFEYYSDTFRRSMVRRWFKWFAPHFDLITTHNEYLGNFIIRELQVHEARVHYLAQGIETERFIRARTDDSIRARYGVAGNEQLIVYSASLGITSDFELVLPMLIQLLRSCENIKILVIGDGQRRERFARKVEENGMQGRIVFTGYVPHSEIPAILKLARVGINYMAPTLANQCRASIKLREYLAAGLKVVCNPVGDAEIFKNHLTLCSAIEDFPAAIKQTLAEGNRDGAAKAQRFIESNYSWPSIIKSFLTYLNDTNI